MTLQWTDSLLGLSFGHIYILTAATVMEVEIKKQSLELWGRVEHKGTFYQADKNPAQVNKS